MKKLILIIILFLTCSFLPTMRCKPHESYQKSSFVVHAVAKSVTYLDEETQIENYIERQFYAHFDIISTFKGNKAKTEILIHIGTQSISNKKHLLPTKFNSQAMYDIDIGEEYLLELTKENTIFEPTNYWGSILKISRNINPSPEPPKPEEWEIKEPDLIYLNKKLPLSEYNKIRKTNIKL